MSSTSFCSDEIVLISQSAMYQYAHFFKKDSKFVLSYADCIKVINEYMKIKKCSFEKSSVIVNEIFSALKTRVENYVHPKLRMSFDCDRTNRAYTLNPLKIENKKVDACIADKDITLIVSLFLSSSNTTINRSMQIVEIDDATFEFMTANIIDEQIR